VVIANPPYMGGKGMNGRLVAWLKDNYADVKSDLFAAFVLKCSQLSRKVGYVGIMCPNVWMYISAYEKLRGIITGDKTLTNLVELPLTGFKGATVQICAYNFINAFSPRSIGGFIRLLNFKGGDEEMSSRTREAIRNKDCGWFYNSSSAAFNKIPGNPISYWLSDALLNSFVQANESLTDIGSIREGINTGDNDRFLRFWHEVETSNVQFEYLTSPNHLKWFPHRKGGSYRKWAGNMEYVLNWKNEGQEIHAFHSLPLDYNGAPVRGKAFFFKQALSWSRISSGKFSLRYHKSGSTYDSTAPSIFTDTEREYQTLAFLNGKIVAHLLAAISPTLDFRITNLGRLPLHEICAKDVSVVKNNTLELVDTTQSDWDSYETSWDFNSLTLLNPEYRQLTLKATYQMLHTHWREMTQEMQRLEQDNNRIFIEAYGLQDELKSDVPLSEITLTCNPHYRYGSNKNEDELEALLLADTMRELVSYSVGCMFGRYALDRPGLILANQGETIEDYLKRVPEPSFPADDDNVIPMLDGDWFTDDIAERFRKFLRVAFGEEHYEANLQFVEKALNIKGKRNYSIRDYFLGEFYTDHVKRYKKRPIYWLFSSPKGSFNALIYMHRYRPDTVSVVLNDYLREFRTKLTARKANLEQTSISGSATASEKTKALKEIESLKKMIQELEDYERDILYPLATEQVEIDLDDGVKVNYTKFGAALKKIPGLESKGDDNQ
jgi:type II restriction/modification system DNA methylase subunit YeeA